MSTCHGLAFAPMEDTSVRLFTRIAGNAPSPCEAIQNEKTRALGAQLLLSELLEYIIKGLGLTPVIDGHAVKSSDALSFTAHAKPHPTEMLDGLADVAYTMYWNAIAFGLPLEEGFRLVCENNLKKFPQLGSWAAQYAELPKEEWGCRQGIEWPEAVVRVRVVAIDGSWYAAGLDTTGKVRKPKAFESVDLSPLVAQVGNG